MSNFAERKEKLKESMKSHGFEIVGVGLFEKKCSSCAAYDFCKELEEDFGLKRGQMYFICCQAIGYYHTFIRKNV